MPVVNRIFSRHSVLDPVVTLSKRSCSSMKHGENITGLEQPLHKWSGIFNGEVRSLCANKTRGVKILKMCTLRLNLRAFSPSKHAYILLSNVYLKLHKL